MQAEKAIDSVGCSVLCQLRPLRKWPAGYVAVENFVVWDSPGSHCRNKQTDNIVCTSDVFVLGTITAPYIAVECRGLHYRIFNNIFLKRA